MNLDMFECGERIVLNKKIPNLKNIINIYTEVSSSNKYEPIFYDAYAQDIEGKKNNISKYIFE